MCGRFSVPSGLFLGGSDSRSRMRRWPDRRHEGALRFEGREVRGSFGCGRLVALAAEKGPSDSGRSFGGRLRHQGWSADGSEDGPKVDRSSPPVDGRRLFRTTGPRWAGRRRADPSPAPWPLNPKAPFCPPSMATTGGRRSPPVAGDRVAIARCPSRPQVPAVQRCLGTTSGR